jgi:phage tail-like protein
MSNAPTRVSTTRVTAYSAAHFALELSGKPQDIGMFRSIEGGGIKAEVMTYQPGGTYERWRQLGKPKFEDIKLQVGMAMSEPFYQWIAEFFEGRALRKSGVVIAADFNYRERARREFTDAMICEIVFPKLDGADKNTAFMNVAMSVEDIKFKPGDNHEIVQNKGDEAQKAWKACNFTFSLDNFECCRRVTKVDAFTVKQSVLEYHAGGRRSPSKTPSAIEWPQLSFYLPEADAQPLFDHFKKRGVDGGVPGLNRLHGTIDTFDNAQTNHFSTEFFNADIIAISPDKSDASSEEMKLVKVDLYVERMKFAYKLSVSQLSG